MDHLLEALLSSLPVDDVPDSTKVLGLAVLVLKAILSLALLFLASPDPLPDINLLVSMLPCINTQDRPELSNNWVLVGVCLDTNRAGLSILDQPRPAASLNTRQCGVEFLLHGVEGAVVRVDSLGQGPRWWLAAAGVLGRQVLPEEGMVYVAAAVEVDEGLSCDLCLDVAFLNCLGHLLGLCVERCYVGVVMLAVVELHDLAADGRLERAVVVCILRQRLHLT